MKCQQFLSTVHRNNDRTHCALMYSYYKAIKIVCEQLILLTGSLDGTLLVWELPQQLVFQTIAATRLRSHSKRVGSVELL